VPCAWSKIGLTLPRAGVALLLLVGVFGGDAQALAPLGGRSAKIEPMAQPFPAGAQLARSERADVDVVQTFDAGLLPQRGQPLVPPYTTIQPPYNHHTIY
jgi:hypothetical protein